jgi:MoxR-like ATPase
MNLPLFSAQTSPPDNATNSSVGPTPILTKMSAADVVEAAASVAAPSGVATDDPATLGFTTNESHFFGLRRQNGNAFVPTLDEVSDFVFDPVNEDRVRGLADGENLLLLGPPGSGKTLFSKWFAYGWGADFYLMSHNAHTQADEILGSQIQDADTGVWRFVPSNLVLAYERGGVVSADEILALKPGPLQVYHPFLNGDAITVATSAGPKKISRHPKFRFVGTANHWQKTAGNNVIGEALMDRCIVVEVDYIAEALELDAILAAVPSAPPGTMKDLVTFAAAVRNGVKTNPERNHYLPSTRMLKRLARHIARGRADVAHACETMIFQPVALRYPEEVDAIREVFRNVVLV